MQYDQQYIVDFDPNGGPYATRACLIRLAAVTHGFDQDQRRVPLEVVPALDGSPRLWVRAPADGNVAPPGTYMLFILNEYATGKFAPCAMARYVQVGN